MTPQELLDLPIGENEANASTLRGYLKELIYNVWNEGEEFSGKRAFGNSSWEWDLIRVLQEAGVPGNEEVIWNRVNEAIRAL